MSSFKRRCEELQIEKEKKKKMAFHAAKQAQDMISSIIPTNKNVSPDVLSNVIDITQTAIGLVNEKAPPTTLAKLIFEPTTSEVEPHIKKEPNTTTEKTHQKSITPMEALHYIHMNQINDVEYLDQLKLKLNTLIESIDKKKELLEKMKKKDLKPRNSL
jgi:hypothetical protein